MARDVEWYGDDIRAEFKGRTMASLFAAGLQIVAEAQVNITNNGQVDTGFLRLTGYVSGPDDSTYNEISDDGRYRDREGNTVYRYTGPEREPEEDNEVVVGFAAEYALFQELDLPFLFPALESVARQMKGIMKDEFDD